MPGTARSAADFGKVWGGFLERFGGSWRLLGHFFASFWCLYSECSPTGVLKAPGLDFGSIFKGLGRVWGGFWKGFGRVLGEFWEGLEGPKLQFSWTAFFDFVFWLLVLLEGFGSKTICLKIA